jgi:hypothetical protein
MQYPRKSVRWVAVHQHVLNVMACTQQWLTVLSDCVCACSNPIVVTKSTDSAAAAGRQGFNYLFYIDFVGALSNPNCQNALRHLQVRQGDNHGRRPDRMHGDLSLVLHALRTACWLTRKQCAVAFSLCC